MEEAPKVSVIIPVYNTEQYLRQCLDSVVNQTLREIEIICVDDGSTDGSPSILQEYGKRDGRVLVLRQEQKGAGAARNQGLKAAKGEYLSFLDADDFFEETAVEEMYREIRKEDSDICICNARQYDTRTGTYKMPKYYLNKKYLPSQIPFSAETVPEYIFNITTNVAWNKMYKKEFVEREGLRFETVQRANDQFFVMLSLAKAKKIAATDEMLINYRINNSQSLTGGFSISPLSSFETLMRIQEALKELKVWRKVEQSFVNKALNGMLYSLKIQTRIHGFITLYNKMKTEGFAQLGITGRTPDYFYSEREYIRYKELMESRDGESYLLEQMRKGVMQNMQDDFENSTAYKIIRKMYRAVKKVRKKEWGEKRASTDAKIKSEGKDISAALFGLRSMRRI